jgi:hypothetical protein
MPDFTSLPSVTTPVYPNIMEEKYPPELACHVCGIPLFFEGGRYYHDWAKVKRWERQEKEHADDTES